MKAPWFLLLFVNQSLPYISLDLSNTALKNIHKNYSHNSKKVLLSLPFGNPSITTRRRWK